MKIIIDECVPNIVKKELTSHNVVTVQEMGWAGVKNGQLLRLVAGAFDVFITSDKNLRYQQNLDTLDSPGKPSSMPAANPSSVAHSN